MVEKTVPRAKPRHGINGNENGEEVIEIDS